MSLPRPNQPLVWVVDDDADLLHVIAEQLRRTGVAVAAFTSPLVLLRSIEKNGFPECAQCLLADLVMPEMDGISLGNRMQEMGYRCPRILMSARIDIERAVAAMRQGFDQVLEKPMSETTLLSEVGSALNLCRKRLAVQYADADLLTRSHTLGPREREVLELVAVGLMNKQVADQLEISVKTVETYRARVMAKLGIEHLAELIRFGVDLRQAEARSGGRVRLASSVDGNST